MLSRDEHEALLVELFDAETSEQRKAEIQLMLRNDHIEAHTDVESLKSSNSELSDRNQELQIANSQLFREARRYVEPETEEEEDPETFSETVTLSELRNLSKTQGR